MKKTVTIDVIWPEMFETGVIPETMEDANICANALCAWGNCSVSPPPQKFGDVMSAVGKRLNCVPTPNGLELWAKQKGFL